MSPTQAGEAERAPAAVIGAHGHALLGSRTLKVGNCIGTASPLLSRTEIDWSSMPHHQRQRDCLPIDKALDCSAGMHNLNVSKRPDCGHNLLRPATQHCIHQQSTRRVPSLSETSDVSLPHLFWLAGSYERGLAHYIKRTSVACTIRCAVACHSFGSHLPGNFHASFLLSANCY